ncbi:hypothetical protein BC831DRAFT_315670 [Entophlyctis helioformis]|nr:hypothetical protein BC831DRAFT_315670 [Entophlyctis helioformis]
MLRSLASAGRITCEEDDGWQRARTMFIPRLGQPALAVVRHRCETVAHGHDPLSFEPPQCQRVFHCVAAVDPCRAALFWRRDGEVCHGRGLLDGIRTGCAVTKMACSAVALAVHWREQGRLQPTLLLNDLIQLAEARTRRQKASQYSLEIQHLHVQISDAWWCGSLHCLALLLVRSSGSGGAFGLDGAGSDGCRLAERLGRWMHSDDAAAPLTPRQCRQSPAPPHRHSLLAKTMWVSLVSLAMPLMKRTFRTIQTRGTASCQKGAVAGHEKVPMEAAWQTLRRCPAACRAQP